jgi:Domain of unknown function (DU1801)
MTKRTVPSSHKPAATTKNDSSATRTARAPAGGKVSAKAKTAGSSATRTARATAGGGKGPAKAKSASSAGRAARAGGAAREAGNAQTDPAVIAFVQDHPLRREIDAVRQIILGVSPAIREGIKWNAPSFRTTDDFATLNLRGKSGVRIILHMGAKAKTSATTGIDIADPTGLLEWLAKDRCLVSLGDMKDIEAKRAELVSVVRSWIRCLDALTS